MITQDQIKLVLELSEAATLGPWVEMYYGQDDMWVRSSNGDAIGHFGANVNRAVEDSILAAYYRTAAPLLARKLERAMEVMDKVLDKETASFETCAAIATAIGEIEAME